MTPGKLAATMILVAYIFLALAFLTGCSGFGNPQFCVKTDYGTFCYSLPVSEIPALKDK